MLFLGMLISTLEISPGRAPIIDSLDNSGHTEYLIGTTALSMGWYAWSIPISLKIKNYRVFLGSYSIISATGFFLPYFLTQNTPISKATASYTLEGGLIGIVHGLLLSTLLTDNNSPSAILTYTNISSLSEAYTLFYVSKKYNFSMGEGDMSTFIGWVGMLNGIAYPYMLSKIFKININKKIYAFTTLSFSLAGQYLGYLFSKARSYTRGDVLIMLGSTFYGIFLPATFLFSLDSKIESLNTLFLISGSYAGLYIGDYLVKNKEFSTFDGTMVLLGQSGGALLATGITYMLFPHNIKLNLYSSLIGQTVGFAGIYYLALQNKNRTDQVETLSISSLKKSFSIPIFNISLQFK